MESQRTQILIGAGFLVVIVAIMVTLAVMSRFGQESNTTSTATTTPVTAQDHTRGNTSAKVSVVEYADFECPACAQYEPLLTKLYNTYGDRVQFAFRQFPLYEIHQNATLAAQAAQAAANQDAFWPMHTLLYEKQAQWSTLSTNDLTKMLHSYAQELGLDVSRFDADLTAQATIDKVIASRRQGDSIGIDHTPTFFINNEEITSPTSYESFAARIEQALAQTQP